MFAIIVMSLIQHRHTQFIHVDMEVMMWLHGYMYLTASCELSVAIIARRQAVIAGCLRNLIRWQFNETHNTHEHGPRRPADCSNITHRASTRRFPSCYKRVIGCIFGQMEETRSFNNGRQRNTKHINRMMSYYSLGFVQ